MLFQIILLDWIVISANQNVGLPIQSVSIDCVSTEQRMMYCKTCQEAKADNVFATGSDSFRKDKLDKHKKSAGHAQAVESLRFLGRTSKDILEPVSDQNWSLPTY